MISVKWQGRLCNRMFQYAVLYAVAKRTGFPMGTDPWEGEEYFRLPRLPKARPKQIYAENPAQKFDPSVFAVKDGTELVGYFQTDRYFAEMRDEVIKLFKLNQYLTTMLDMELRRFTKPIVTVHSREGDFATSNGVFPVISRSYIKAAIDLVVRESGRSIEEYDVVLLSDNPKSTALDFLPKFHRSKLPGILDLFLMTKSKVCILSASSFSWWGAWLNTGQPLIVGPNFWINARRPREGWFPADAEVAGWRYLDEEQIVIKPEPKKPVYPRRHHQTRKPLGRPRMRIRHR